MRQWLPIITILLCAVLLGSLDTAFFPAIGPSFYSVNFTIIACLAILVIFRFQVSVSIFMAATILLGLTGSSLFFFQLVVGTAMLITANWLFESFFTNRSYYSLVAISSMGLVAYYLFLAIAIELNHLFRPDEILPSINASWLQGFLITLVFNLVFDTVFYFSSSYLSNQIKSYFVISSR